MRNKKALLTLTELVKLILTTLVILLVFLPMYSCLFRLVTGQPPKEMTNSFKRIGNEVEALIETEASEGERIIPTKLNEDYAIMLFNKNDVNIPVKCKKKTCFCLYKQDKLNEAPYLCKEFKDTILKSETEQEELPGLIFPAKDYEQKDETPFTDIFVKMVKREDGKFIVTMQHKYAKEE